MRWLSSLGIGLLTAVATTVAGYFAAEAATGWHRVSDREGGRGMLIVFVLLPAAFIAGLIIGTWVARRGPFVPTAGALGRLGIAMAVAVGAVLLTTGMAWITADHPPTIDGHPLTLELELRLPPAFPVRDSLEENELRVGVVASSRDRAYADLDFDSVTRDQDFIVVRGRRSLVSTGFRTLSVTWGKFEEHRPSQFVPVPLAPRPSRKDLEWSEWFRMNQFMDLTPVPDAEQAQVRYRVVLRPRTEP